MSLSVSRETVRAREQEKEKERVRGKRENKAGKCSV